MIQKLGKAAICLSILTFTTSVVIADPIQDANSYTVEILTTIDFPFFRDRSGSFEGAGFLIDKENGIIVTNAHVVGHGNSDVEVAFQDYGYIRATSLYVDPNIDLAFLRVPSDELPEDVTVANLDCIGEHSSGAAVVAFGHPLGLSYSASRGVVSKRRTYEGHDWIQTDAAINPGNSGGPLIKLPSGDVIGINTMLLSESEGIGFAVPSEFACRIYEMLVKDLDPSPPILPFSLTDDLTIAAIVKAEGTDKFSIGDYITSAAGRKVSTRDEIDHVLRNTKGEALISARHGESSVSSMVKFDFGTQLLHRNHVLADGALISEDVFPYRRKQEGYFMVHSVDAGSKADRAGLYSGDVIISINGTKPNSLNEISDAFEESGSSTIILRSWSKQDQLLYDYLAIEFSPQNVLFRQLESDRIQTPKSQ